MAVTIAGSNVAQTIITASDTFTQSFSPNVGTNKLIVVKIFLLNQSTTPPNVVSISRNGKNFTEVVAARSTFGGGSSSYGQGRRYLFYLLDPDVDAGSHNIVATLDANVGFGILSRYQVVGAYQGDPVTYDFISGENDVGPTSNDILDTQSGGLMLGSILICEATDAGEGNPSMTAPSAEAAVGLITNHSTATGNLPWGSIGRLATQRSGASSAGVSEVGLGWRRSTDDSSLIADWFALIVEIKTNDWTPSTPGTDPDTFCLDIGNVEVIALRSTLSGLTHLAGQTVGILADGVVLDQVVIPDTGVITLNDAAAVAHVGIPYQSDIETLNLDISGADGTIQGNKVLTGHVTLRLVDSRGGYVGPDEDNLYEAVTTDITGEGDAANGVPPPLFSGDVRVLLGAQYEDGGRVFFRQVDPLPVNITAIMAEVEIGGSSSP